MITPRYAWPAEWSRHDATWIAWPHHESDWPGKAAPIPWVYAEIVRVLSAHERVDILCHNDLVESSAHACLDAHGVHASNVRMHRQRTDRSWLRDSAPTGVHDPAGNLVWLNWAFNAWAKYDNYSDDVHVGECVARVTHATRVEPLRDSGDHAIVLEGGGIETDGQGTMLVTEEWLLSEQQVRNPGFTRDDYERAFAKWLGIKHTIWLGEGCVGDDTHGHIDDVARFVAPGRVVLAHEADPADENHRRSLDNLKRLQSAKDVKGEPIRVTTLPYPRPVIMDGMRLPASYANFYIANGVVLVPTFNDANDRVALNTLAELFPERAVIGIHSVDLVWGLGTLHCLTQQQPAPRSPAQP